VPEERGNDGVGACCLIVGTIVFVLIAALVVMSEGLRALSLLL
jgi:hypothetical protein